jgi:hypothetical protein
MKAFLNIFTKKKKDQTESPSEPFQPTTTDAIQQPTIHASTKHQVIIPGDALGIIFEFLDTSSLLTVGLVSKFWHNQSIEDRLWQSQCILLAKQQCDDYTTHIVPRPIVPLEKPFGSTWKKVYIDLKKELSERVKERMRVDSQIFARYACGMRYHPPSPPVRSPHIVSEPTPVGGFTEHPDSNMQELVTDFSVPDFRRAAKNLFQFEQELTRLFSSPLHKSLFPIALARYHKFMRLKAKYPNTFLVPTADIEMVWQSHLIRPSLYHAYCAKLLGSTGKLFPHALYSSEIQIATLENAI